MDDDDDDDDDDDLMDDVLNVNIIKLARIRHLAFISLTKLIQ